jgi:phosphatidylinositol-3-phosphatase
MAATITVVLAALLSGCASTLGGGTPPLAPSTSALSSTSQEAPIRPPSALASQPSHLIVVIEENHSFEQIIGSPAAPFLNHLAAHGILLTNYHAVTHPSLPNYMALLGHAGDAVTATIPAVARPARGGA